jgi:hypothetical protein
MRSLAHLIFALLALTIAAAEANADALLSALPDFYYRWRGYSAEPYIAAAIALQGMEHQAASERLLALARDKERGRNAILLCRMLFVPKPNAPFRRARIGGAVFMGSTDYSDWPREPIELVDGIPFLITKGYNLGGWPEPPEWYVAYCLTNCQWNSFRFVPKTSAEKAAASTKLLSSPKWRTPLDARDREFLKGQIAPAKEEPNPKGCIAAERAG